MENDKLIRCSTCNNLISGEAMMCPHCGQPTEFAKRTQQEEQDRLQREKEKKTEAGGFAVGLTICLIMYIVGFILAGTAFATMMGDINDYNHGWGYNYRGNLTSHENGVIFRLIIGGSLIIGATVSSVKVRKEMKEKGYFENGSSSGSSFAQNYTVPTFAPPIGEGSVNNTVKTIKNIPKEQPEKDRKKIRISESNMTDSFLPCSFEFEVTANGCKGALNIKKIGNDSTGDLICDLILYNRFKDQYKAENVSFLNFKPAAEGYEISDSSSINIPSHILDTLENCSIVVKKYFINNQLQEAESYELHAIDIEDTDAAQSEKINKIISIIDKLEEFDSAQKMMDYLSSANNDLESEDYSKIYNILKKRIESEKNIGVNTKLTMQKIKTAFVDAYNSQGKIKPIIVDEFTIECPLCGSRATAGRKECFECGFKFN